MAAVVSHAMRRFPTTPPDDVYSSYRLRGEGSSKPWTLEEGESALSRSMRYADPWLYGSVRAHGGLLLTPAFVLCACSDYVNGTKRSKKGPTTCKKCKGTRLPLSAGDASKFGTVRCYPTSLPTATTPIRAGTVRVCSSSRPSILPTADPYDLMRRSRLSVSEGASQFRARSISPSKAKNGEGRSHSATRGKGKSVEGVSSPTGRRSILECDINPYELMSTDSPAPAPAAKDASITFVNGQRIRVRPPTHDASDYEDVQVQPRRQSSSHSSHQTKTPHYQNIENNSIKSPSSPKLNEKESEFNRFKSILKKPATTFSDTDSNGPEQKPSPSPSRKTGSHFYLPMPANTPRKKVQFLVENELFLQGTETDKTQEENANSNGGEIEQCKAENVADEAKNNDTSTDEDETSRKVCKLRRSVSERFTQDSAKVVFHDTMALRTRTIRSDSRAAFTDKDLQRLDGLTPRVRKVSPSPQRPVQAPPPPPKIENKQQEKTEQEIEKVDTRKKSLKFEDKGKSRNVQQEKEDTCTEEAEQILISKKNEDKQLKNEVLEKHKDDSVNKKNKARASQNPAANASESKVSNIVEKDQKIQLTNDSRREEIRELVQENLKIHAKNFWKSVEKAPEIIEKVIKIESMNHTSNKNKAPEVIEDHKIQVKEEDKKEDKVSKSEMTNISQHNNFNEVPPCAPPRKRSNNKPPQINIVQTSSVQTLKIQSPTDNSPKKTIVKINCSEPPSPVHKLQIKNDFSETANYQSISILDNPQRKTSILINGDDCYSTVNVNDDVPLYQSSVVVKDCGSDTTITTCSTTRKSSSIYITGSFENTNNIITSSTLQENTIHNISGNIIRNENVNNYNDINTNADKNRENQKEHYQVIAASNKNDVVTKDYNNVGFSEKKLSREDSSHPTDSFNEDSIPSSEVLKELLKDPVEAVRRNLVPHVCGKSDMTRRQRDRKFFRSRFLNESLRESPLEYSARSSNELETSSRLRTYESIGDDVSEHSSSTQYELMDAGSDCYTDHSNRSSVTEDELVNRTKFYELLADSNAIEISENEDHHYESIKMNNDPIYEEIEVPPPLPTSPPPTTLLDDLQLDKEFTTRSIFEGASKYDILSYLVDAKERGIVSEDTFICNLNNSTVSPEEETKEQFPRICHLTTVGDSSEDNSLITHAHMLDDKSSFQKTAEVERNDSGVGSETSKSSLSKYRIKQEPSITCEDCETSIDNQAENEPLVCRKCMKKRSERKEIIMEIVETEEKYSRDLQIILEEFYQPMLVAGLLTPEQLSAIFLNVEELLENSQALAERLRDAVEIALEQGDEDLLTVNIGKLFLEAAPMLHAFETYCVRQGAASLLLASLEKDKELLRIFLRVSQMENTLLRRMNLNSFLMVPVQRVTKYPLLLARLYKVTPQHHETREHLKEAQHKIELHLNHMNSETKDIPSKLWRRIGSSSGRRSSNEMDLVNIKLRKIAVDVLEWNHEEAKFALEGKLLFTQPTDNNWRKGRTIKLTPVNALLVTNGKSLTNRTDKKEDTSLMFSRHSGVREAALLLVRDKNGRYSLLREPLYLDRCIIAADPTWQSYFEVQELGKDTFIFKAEDDDQTRMWYRQMQHYAQGMGAWRRRRNALANIMINGMGLRS